VCTHASFKTIFVVKAQQLPEVKYRSMYFVQYCHVSISKVISMNDVVDQVLTALRAAGETGLLITELVDRLGVGSKEVSLAITTLTSEGKIVQKTAEDDRYMIRTPLSAESESGRLSDMDGCPCYHCLRIGRCGIRQPDSPVTCKEFEDWMASASATA
jgi:hypothetical protein